MPEHATVPEWELHHRLRRALELAGLTATEMAAVLDVHPNTLSNYLMGKTTPNRATLLIWSERCSVPFEWLVGTMTCFDVPLAAVPDPDEATQMQLAYAERPDLTAVHR